MIERPQEEVVGFARLSQLIDKGSSEVTGATLRQTFKEGKITQEELNDLNSKLIERMEYSEEGISDAAIRLEKESITDHLTGIFNRRGLERELHAAIQRLNSKKDESEDEVKKFEKKRKASTDHILFFLIDLNAFKPINDTYGHEVGDEALKLVARYLEEEAIDRKGRGARFGGDEFALLQETEGDVTSVDLQRIARRVQKKINSRLSMPTKKGELKFTVSVGCAMLKRGENKTAKELRDEADAQMYLMKAENGAGK